LRADLKVERDVVFLIESVRFVGNIGAEKEKARYVVYSSDSKK